MGRVCTHSRPRQEAPDLSPCLLPAAALFSQPLSPKLLSSTFRLSEANSMESQVVPSSRHRPLHAASFPCRLLPELREHLLPRAAALSQTSRLSADPGPGT